MRCIDFINEETLGREAGQYGSAGGRPQVVWSNGVLASSAIGLAMDLICGWTGLNRTHEYLVYDGNYGTLTQSKTIQGKHFASCPHFPLGEMGDPVFQPL